MAPVINRDPLVALELGLSPEVHAFVASLQAKDAITRDHVVRVGELATRVAVRAGLPPGRVRAVGLAALVHDIGKLVIPSDILGRTSGLTDDEFALMKTQAEQGAALLAASPVLAPAAPLVRGHHERPDGTGYPDGLRGEQISIGVGIVSVCDAWDAMTNDRQHRNASATIARPSYCSTGPAPNGDRTVSHCCATKCAPPGFREPSIASDPMPSRPSVVISSAPTWCR